MKKIFTAIYMVLILCCFAGMLSACDIMNVEEITGIEIDTTNTKTVYAVDDSFSSVGLVVYNKYEGGNKKATTSYSIDSSSFKTDTSGTYTIGITSGDYTATYDVYVYSQSDANSLYTKALAYTNIYSSKYTISYINASSENQDLINCSISANSDGVYLYRTRTGKYGVVYANGRFVSTLSSSDGSKEISTYSSFEDACKQLVDSDLSSDTPNSYMLKEYSNACISVNNTMTNYDLTGISATKNIITLSYGDEINFIIKFKIENGTVYLYNYEWSNSFNVGSHLFNDSSISIPSL